MSKTLNAVRPGESCVVSGLAADGKLGQRLLDLGFYPGKLAHVVRDAPLYDPMYLLIDGSCVSLRRDEAACIEVTLVS